MRLIAGSGRSGTTWVLDCLADANELRPVFEPLRPESSEVGRRFAYRYIERQAPHPELANYFHELQRPEYWSLWTTFRSPRDKLFPGLHGFSGWHEIKQTKYRWGQFLRNSRSLYRSSRRSVPLVKCIRANLGLGWFVANLNAKVILIARHPCAVIESQLRLGSDGHSWDPLPIIERFRGDKNLERVSAGRYVRLLAQSLSRIEALTLVWVIENQFPIKLASQQGYDVVYYEDLMDAPHEQWPRICRILTLERTPDAHMLRRPSQQASARMPANGAMRDASWMAHLDSAQLGQIQGILDAAECNIYQVSSVRPERPNNAADVQPN